MVELLIADESDPEPGEIRRRVANPTPDDIGAVLRPDQDVWYGTYYLLRGDGIDLEAISTVGPLFRPGEPGEFLVYDHGKSLGDRSTLDAVVEIFRRALLGALRPTGGV
jgi:hypothetical protein